MIPPLTVQSKVFRGGTGITVNPEREIIGKGRDIPSRPCNHASPATYSCPGTGENAAF